MPPKGGGRNWKRGYKKNYNRTNKKSYYGKYGLATKPKLMPYQLKQKKRNQVDTKTFWFKNNDSVYLNDQPFQYFEIRTSYLYAANPNGWQECCNMFDQFKILGIEVSLYPASVGIEPLGETTNIATPLYLNRGNHCVWTDQRFDGNVISPTSIQQIIGTGSARLINARRPYKISIWRPSGKYVWGSCKDFAAPINPLPDPWTGTINHFIEGGSIQPTGTEKIIYYRQVTIKVVFRGRQDD